MVRWGELTRQRVRAFTRASSVASWSSAVDTILALVYAVIAAGFLVVMALPAAVDAASAPGAVAVVLGAFLVAQVLAVRDLAAHGRERARFLPVVLILSLGAITYAFHVFTPRPGDMTWWPLNILTLMAIYLIAVTYASRLAWVATLLAVGGVLLAVFVAIPVNAEDQLLLGLNQLVVVAGLLATADLFTRGLRTIALESDLADKRRIADLRTTSRAGREADRLRDVERYIHDEVLHTLRAIAMDRADLPGSQVRAWTERLSAELTTPSLEARVGESGETFAHAPAGSTAVRAEGGTGVEPVRQVPDADSDASVRAHVEEVPTTSAYADLVARLTSLEIPLEITWDTPRSVPLPREVTEAFVAATAEALRNVARHAGVPGAKVTVRADGIDVTVTVRDEGCGFDPREPRLTRHGVARSVLGRMNDLGGTARMDSAPGQGTTVTLHWAPRVPRVGGRSFPWNDHTVRDLVRRCILVLVPSAVAAVALVFLGLPYLHHPLPAVAAAATICLVVILVPRLSLKRGLTPAASMGLLALGVAVALSLGLATDRGSAQVAGLAALPYAALIPGVLLFTRPLWEGVIGWLLMTGVTSFVCLGYVGTPQDVQAMWSVLVSPAVALAGALSLRFGIDLYGSATYFAIDARDRALGEASRTAAVRTSVISHLDRVNRSVRTFIDEVADGTLDVASPAVRSRADELERAVREDLSLGVAPGVREAIDTLRDHDAVVDVRVPAHPPSAVDRTVAAVVDALMRAEPRQDAEEARSLGAVGSRHLGLTVTPRAEAWTVALLARIESEEQAAVVAQQWRGALASLGVTVMTIGGDVRARVMVPVPETESSVNEGRRDA